MESDRALAAFAALAQPTRLDAFRLLVREGPGGLAAGEIAARLGVVQNTMSTHLAALVRAGLLRPERRGRSIAYAADMEGARGLVGFLMQDCCGGRPELCAPAIKALGCDCAAAA